MGDPLLLVDKIIVLSITLFGLWLGFWVWNSDKKKRLNQWFAAMAVSVVLWTVFAFLGSLAEDASKSAFFYRLNWAAVALFLVSAFCFYIIHFLNYKGNKRYEIFGKFIVSIGVVLIFLSVFTDTIIKKTGLKSWGIEITFGPANIFFNIYAFSIALLVVILLVKKYFQSPRPEKLKTQYFLIGTILFAVLNVIFNIISPMVMKTVAYQHFGDYSAIFLLGFTAYAIAQRELFGIKVVLTALLVGIIAVLLFLDAFVITQQPSLQIIKASTLIVFLLFGYSLIKSILREIKLREELQKAYEEVEKLSKTKSEFISIASHQLRTPLAAIKGYISMVLEGTYGQLSEKQTKPLRNVYQSNERLIQLVNDLLNLSRLEAGKIEFEPKTASLIKIVSDIIEEIKINAEQKGLSLKLIKPLTPLPEIMLDQNKIRQVILNIIDNAIKYTKQGNITVELGEIDGREQIKITDTGEGLTQEEITSLFQMYSRATAGTQLHTEGAGIGLYVARKFLEMHQGRIWTESKGKGKGSTFYIELPIK